MKRYAGPLIALVSGVLTIMFGELMLAKYFPFPDPFAERKLGDRPINYMPFSHPPNFSLRTVAEKGLPGVSGTSVFTTNNMGFRGPTMTIPKERGEYRVFLVGGSTIECLVVDDSQAPNRVLQDLLSDRILGRHVRVYNAGRSGAKSFDHVAIVAHRIAQLEPDLIIVFAGANDLRAAMLNVDYLLLPRSRGEPYSFMELLKFAATEFQIPRRIYAIIHRVGGKSERERMEEVQSVTDYRDKVALKDGKPVTDQMPRTDLVPYGRNLASIASVARAQGAHVMFVTQASTWNSQVDRNVAQWHWLNYVNGKVYREDLMDRALESYNSEMRRVARVSGVPVLDVAHLIPKTLEFFYDDMHFNAKGAAMFASLVAQFVLREKLLLEKR